MRIRALDLFCGGGGSSLGAQMAGAEIVAGIDCWEVATECYQDNFPTALSVNENIKKVSPRGLRETIGDIDLLLASPECTSHSCAKGGRAGSERSRLTAHQVTRFAKVFKPRWIVIENVVQMKLWDGYAKLQARLSRLGYHVTEQTLNAQDFGVPQSRRRLFNLCSLTGRVDPIEIADGKAKPAESIIDPNGNYPFTPLFSPTRARATIERAERAMAALGKEEPFLIVYYSSDRSGGWQPIDRPLRTITTLDRFAYVRYSPKGHEMRMLQPEELKLAMGFPKSYKLDYGNRRDKVKLMGNAVCPPVMKYAIRWLLYSSGCAPRPAKRNA